MQMDKESISKTEVAGIVDNKLREFQAKMDLEEVQKKAISLRVKPLSKNKFESSGDERK